MGRIRSIKPRFFLDSKMSKMGQGSRLLFIGLWTLADRAGRLEDNPDEIRIQVFPYEPAVNVDAYLSELEAGGFIQRYAMEASRFIQIVNFLKHQMPHHTERPSIIPPQKDGELTVPLQESNGETRVGKGKGKDNGKGSGKGTTTASSPTGSQPPILLFPTNGAVREWGLTADVVASLQAGYPHMDALAECRKALTWCQLNPTKRKTATGMARFLAGWMGRANDRRSETPKGGVSTAADRSGSPAIPGKYDHLG